MGPSRIIHGTKSSDLRALFQDRTDCTVVQWTGYSTKYAEPDRLKSHVKEAAIAFGPNTVHVAGVTGDGIGVLYSVMKELRESNPRFGDTLVAGIVSEAALEYEDSWGDQDLAIVFKSMDPDSAWSLKEGGKSKTADVISEAVQSASVARVYHVLLEGGAQSFEECVEIIGRPEATSDKFCLVLETGWQPADKAREPAATRVLGLGLEPGLKKVRCKHGPNSLLQAV